MMCARCSHPPRLCRLAARKGLKAGYSIDMATVDEVTGRSYDLRKENDQKIFWTLLARRSPKLLVVSPPCTTFSSLQYLRKTPMKDQEREEGVQLLRIGIRACRSQLRSGRGFIFEHPLTASSWQDEDMKKLREHPDVMELTIDQCMYGLASHDELGTAPAKKKTRILTNLAAASLFCLRLATACIDMSTW